MNNDEVLTVLIYANELDGRHSPNEVKILAWQDVLSEGAAGLTLEFARDCVRKHYAATDEMLSPATLVAAWKKHSRYRADLRISATLSLTERHCGIPHCVCTHGDPCFKGWLDSADHVVPCQVCRTDLAQTLRALPDPGERSEHDWAVLRQRVLK